MAGRGFHCALGTVVLFVVTTTAIAGEVPGHGFPQSQTGFIATSQYPPEVTLTFDGSFTDSGRRGQDGTATGGVALVGGADAISGMAAQFDGTGRIIVGPADGSSLNFGGNHTIAFWIRIDDDPEGFQSILFKGNVLHPTNQADADLLGTWTNDDGTVTLREPHAGAVTTVTSVDNGQFHHLAVVRNEDDSTPIPAGDPFAGVMRLATTLEVYVDGVSEAKELRINFHTRQQAEGPVSLGAGTEHLFAGINPGSNFPGWVPAPGDPDVPDARFPTLIGVLDDLMILPGALSAAQIGDIADRIPAGAPNANAAITSLTVTPLNGLAGDVRVQVSVAGNDPFVALVVTRQAVGGAGLPGSFLPEDSAYVDSQVGPVRGLSDVTIALPAGTWTVSAYAYEDLRALPAAADEGSMTSAPFTLEPLPRIDGPVVYETPEGAAIGLQAENYSIYEDDDEASRGPVGVPGTPAENVNSEAFRGPFIFFSENTASSFGPVYRRDAGLDRRNSGFLLRYDFDLDWSGGEEGTHVAWMRGVNPYNTSDFSIVTGDPDDQGLGLTWPFVKENGYTRDDHRINEWNSGGPFPSFGAGRTARYPCDIFGLDIYGPTLEDARAGRCVRITPDDRNGHIKEFQDGENEIFLTHRQGGPGRGRSQSAWMDMWLYSTDFGHIPGDLDILAAVVLRTFIRGDCNGDGTIDISDGLRALGVAFLGDAPADCMDACDFNASGSNDVSNAVFFFHARFGGGPPLPKPRSCNFAAPLLGCTAGTCSDVPFQALPDGPDGAFDFTPLNKR